MKKYFKVLMILVVVTLFSVAANASTKYDFIKTDVGWKSQMSLWNSLQEEDSSFLNYIDLLANERDVIRLAKSGKFNSDRSKFMIENSKSITKIVQVQLAKMLLTGDNA
jgi:hypothetical protein